MVRYRSGYRFQLAEPFTCQTPVREACAGSHWVGLAADGTLTVAAGYAWDGASGPIAQGPDIVRGSLVHDALYQLMREHGLDARWRETADDLLRSMLIEDGMHPVMATIAHAAVRAFGGCHIDPIHARPVLIAPAPVAYPSAVEFAP
jgi:hypothetical protein